MHFIFLICNISFLYFIDLNIYLKRQQGRHCTGKGWPQPGAGFCIDWPFHSQVLIQLGVVIPVHAKFMCTTLRGMCDLQCQCNVTVQTNRKRQHKAPAQAGWAPWRSAPARGGKMPFPRRQEEPPRCRCPARALLAAGPGPRPRWCPRAARPGPAAGREGGREHGAARGPAAGEGGPAPWGGRAARLARAESCQVSGVLGAFRGSQALGACFLIAQSAFFHFRILENALLN